MKITHLLESNQTITLNQLYAEEFPDEREKIWNFVGLSDFDKPLPINILPPERIKEMFDSQYGVMTAKARFNKLPKEQREYVKSYMKFPLQSLDVIVTAGDEVVDGNHRALAALLNNAPLKFVDLYDLD